MTVAVDGDEEDSASSSSVASDVAGSGREESVVSCPEADSEGEESDTS